ncbi:PREDICTED: uncharacterized protein LOC107063789 [Polistes dominula]|uniref:Uncharacterized protein LOC107063789 n=1 Tax=Polistes dominula TaxID=743375 RepID=A0ABM1HTS8_POLDO|nr:PREDICTED: uncharacterized protein LOC107063789 [Polistes dominula]
MSDFETVFNNTLRFEFVLKEAPQNSKENIYAITSIQTVNGETYAIPEEYQDAPIHTDVLQTEAFQRVISTLKFRNQSTKVLITLDENMRKTYIDDEGNMQFGDYYLEEITSKSQPKCNITDYNLSRMWEAVSKISNEYNPQRKRNNLKDVAERFLIEKFTGKNVNGIQWLNRFEKECSRLDINEDEEKIEIFRLFLEGSCLDWYSCMLIEHSIKSRWEIWKNSFCTIYADVGWPSVRYAFRYKYINGSFIDYAFKKEKMLLDINESIDTCTLIDLIALGLPDFVINKIDREELKTTTNLIRRLRSLQYMEKKKNTKNKTANKDAKEDSEKKQQKRPCQICEKKGKMNRFHPESLCWFK